MRVWTQQITKKNKQFDHFRWTSGTLWQGRKLTRRWWSISWKGSLNLHWWHASFSGNATELCVLCRGSEKSWNWRSWTKWRWQKRPQQNHILALWDERLRWKSTIMTSNLEEKIPMKILTFGRYEGTVWSSIFYFIDNEIHHRAQGYVFCARLTNLLPFGKDKSEMSGEKYGYSDIKNVLHLAEEKRLLIPALLIFRFRRLCPLNQRITIQRQHH